MNKTKLKMALDEHLFGQHLAKAIILRVLTRHLEEENPERPLVLVFEGTTGVGKTYTRKFIVEYLYKKGEESQFVHRFHPKEHFPYAHKVESYQLHLIERLKEAGKRCSRSIVIFEEADKLHGSALLDVLHSFVGNEKQVYGADFRKFVFIIISNRQGQLIANYTLAHWESGKARKDITVKELDEVLTVDAYTDTGGPLAKSLLIKHNRVSYFVPFLPLLHEHVKECATVAMKKSGVWRRYSNRVRDQIASEVADAHFYIPREFRLFSSSGCTNVESKLQLVLGNYEDGD